MVKSTYEILNKARQHTIECENDLVSASYNRAISQGLPSHLIELHRMTKGYMLLSMAEYSPALYFEALKKAKAQADANEQFRPEYQAALETLVNIKSMFLRDVAVNYFCEVSTCSWGSNYGKSLDDLHMYINKFINDIIENDCYGFATYKPSYDLKKLYHDLKTVETYALNLLLMYVTHKDTHYAGKTYTTIAMDFGDVIYAESRAHDKYTHNAVARPRLHQLNKAEYYPDYLEMFENLKKEFNISSESELKAEVSRLVDRKGARSQTEKEYFKYAKKLAKDDHERRSFYSTFGGNYPGYDKMIKPILKFLWGCDAVGSFKLDQPFTRKRGLGVCNMIAWANDWSVEMVRTVTAISGLFLIGAIAYIGLFAAMKMKYYVPNFLVEKHL